MAALPALPAGADVLRAGPWGMASRSRACTPCVVVGALLRLVADELAESGSNSSETSRRPHRI